MIRAADWHSPTPHRAARITATFGIGLMLACSGGGGDSGPGVTPPPPPTPTLAVSAASSAIAASSLAPATVGVTITRGGGFAGSVTLTAENLPTGVSASFATATLSSSAASTTLALNVGATAVAGVSTISIRASGSGVAASTTTVQLTITVPSISITSSASSLSVPAGGSGTASITLERRDGFTGAVNIAAEGVPTGVTVSFAPTSFGAGVTQSVLTVSAGANAVSGSSTVTLRATGSGVAERTLTLQLVVQAEALIPVTYTFCDQARLPKFFAVRDGTNGEWRPVTRQGNSYTWTFAGNFGSFALVWENPLNRLFIVLETYMNVVSITSEELVAGKDLECQLQPVRGKSLAGSIAPVVGASDLAFVSGGWGNALLTPGGSAFSLPDVAPGAIDLIATRFVPAGATNTYRPSQIILRRNVNLPNASVMPVFDFGTSEAFAPTNASITIGNLNGQPASVRSAVNPPGSAQLVIDNGIQSTSNVHTHYGIPLDRLVTGELQEAMVTAVDAPNGTFRQVVRFSRAPANQTMVLGAAPGPVTLSVSNGSAARPRVRGTRQADYDKAVNVLFTQPAARKQAWIQLTAGFLAAVAASTYDLEVPDLSAVPGFSPAWGLTVGSPIDYSLYMSNAPASFSAGFPGTFSVDGATFLFAGRSGRMP